MKTIILYETKYETTAHYARLLAQKYQCDLLHCDQANDKTLDSYDHIIWGMPIYYSKPKGYKKFVKTIKKQLHKKVSVFMVGGTQVDEPHMNELRNQFLDPISTDIAFKYYQGIITKESLGFLDKKIYAMLIKSFQAKPKDQLNVLEQSLHNLSETNRSLEDCVIE